MTFLSRRLIVLGLAVLIIHICLVSSLPLFVRSVAALLLLLLPGALMSLRVFEAERDPLLTFFLAFCGGIAGSVMLLWGAQAIPGPLSQSLLIILNGFILAASLLFVRGNHRSDATSTWAPHPYALLGLVLLLGAALRLPFLGGAEFQGDEARAILMATGVHAGHDDTLLLHKKGPVEILFPAGILALTGQINEGGARLPFALAGLAALLGVYLLARTLCDAPAERANGALVGLIAAAILAVDGFLIGFARIVQYQSIVVLMMIGACLLCRRFSTGSPQPIRNLTTASLLVAVGFLAHYDMIFVVPALLWLVLIGCVRRGWSVMSALRHIALPGAAGGALLLGFYVPFVLNPQFTRTAEYLANRTEWEGASSTFNHLRDHYYPLATFYNTTFQIHWLGAILAIGIGVWLMMYSRPRLLGGALAALLGMACFLLVGKPGAFVIEGVGDWGVIAFGLPLAGLVPASATPQHLRILTLWFAAPFITQSFLVGEPGTHFYAMDTAAALLIGLTLARLAAWLQTQRIQWLQVLPAVSVVGVVALAAPYLYLVFIRQSPEYKTVFPEARPAIYQASYGDTLPDISFFGFPHQSGWNVIGALYQQGVLNGSYFSNEEELITGWYTQGALRCAEQPDYYFVAQSPRDPIRIPEEEIQQHYRLFGAIEVAGDQTLMIYSRDTAPREPLRFNINDYRQDFSSALQTPIPIATTLDLDLPQHPLDASWQPGLTLQGYDLDRRQLAPGQMAALTLHWRATRSIDPRYEVVATLRDSEGRTVREATPTCGPKPIDTWDKRPINHTAFVFDNGSDLAPGVYSLNVEVRRVGSAFLAHLTDGRPALMLTTLTLLN